MIRPTTLCLKVLGLATSLAFIQSFFGSGTFSILLVLPVLALLLFDLILGLKKNELHIERFVEKTLPVQTRVPIKLKVTNRGSSALKFEIFDHYPEEHDAEDMPFDTKLQPGQFAERSYTFLPLKRGSYSFGLPYLKSFSPLGLWEKIERKGEEQDIKIYPDYSEVIKFATLASNQNLNQMGILKKRQRGEGTEFHQLREFRKGDRLSQIDWKATARHRKPIAREFQIERDQQVLFILDCGKRMRSADNNVTHFDQALNSMILLSHVAIEQGDSAGLLTFAGEERWLAPEKSPSTVNKILNATYDIETHNHSSDFMRMAERCQTLLKKRSLIIILSNMRDEDNTELVPALSLLQHRHLVLFVSLKERILEDIEKEPIHDFEDALTYNSVNDFNLHREQVLEELSKQNILCMETIAEDLPVRLTNQYLDIKSRGLL